MTTQSDHLLTHVPSLAVGDRIRFTPRGGTGNRWWTIRARSDRYIFATQQAAFRPAGDLVYTVVDTGWDITYNGVPPGVARSSLNTLGGGYECSTDEECAAAIAELEDGTWELSHRRILAVRDIEVKS